ncbi:hypothetical protein NBRC3293_0581 [Gluconobacter oxydans NBRC 3293]|uniref:Uncharacterized protein n=1 Tax=Gluconobacter oxydans NBRC 3293 TaxID=1315969 RepID=A0A829WW05_GLUOY|nr:hypothetical protein NBRC3293_0581 [Gluconobacter oxydans NBRC 3293]
MSLMTGKLRRPAGQTCQGKGRKNRTEQPVPGIEGKALL